MKKKFFRFLVRLLLFSAILGLLAYLLYLILPENTLPPALPWLFALFIAITMAVHAVLLKITELRPGRFVSYFMLTTLAKLIVYFIAVLIYVFSTKEGLLAFIHSFFILYIFYTVFEVAAILTQTRATETDSNH